MVAEMCHSNHDSSSSLKIFDGSVGFSFRGFQSAGELLSKVPKLAFRSFGASDARLAFRQ
jgi:hypothetical protein